MIAESEEVHVPFRYRGYYWDKESELYFLNARYYDPKMQEFISRDQVEGDLADPLSLNKFSYFQNNLVSYVDPDGNFVVSLLWMYARGVATDVIVGMATDRDASFTDVLANPLWRNLNPLNHIKIGGKFKKVLRAAKNAKKAHQTYKKIENRQEKITTKGQEKP